MAKSKFGKKVASRKNGHCKKGSKHKKGKKRCYTVAPDKPKKKKRKGSKKKKK